MPVSAYDTEGTYRSLGGQEISLSLYEGKPLMIEAIQTTCSHCNDEDHRARMNALASEFGGDAVFLILTINSGDTVEDMNAFIARHNINWIAGFDIDNVLGSVFQVSGTPTTILLDQNGAYYTRWVGHADLDSYVGSLNNLIGSDISIQDTFTHGGGMSGPSFIENIFSNPFFQGGFVIILLLLIYFKSMSTPVQNPEEEIITENMNKT